MKRYIPTLALAGLFTFLAMLTFFIGCKKEEDKNSTPAPTTGSAFFYFIADCGQGATTITLNSQTQTLNKYYPDGEPGDCGDNGGATFSNINAGTYPFRASNAAGSWNGDVVITGGGCRKILLNCSSSTGTCNWQSAVNCLQVTTKRGSRCGEATSLEVFCKNTCSQNVKIFICIQRSDGTWDGLPDGTFDTGTPSGGTASNYVCNSTGYYKVYAMLASDFVNNGCHYPTTCQ